MADLTLNDAPAPVLPRPRTVMVGTAFAVAAVLMYFAGLLGVYLNQRRRFISGGSDWIPESVDVQLTAPSMIWWTMVMSVVTMQWAVYAIKRDDRKHAYLAIATTALLGVMVLNQSAFQYIQLGMVLENSRAEVLIYILSGSFIAMVVAGLLFLFVTGVRALAGQYDSRQADGVAAAAMFWYATVLISGVLWYAIYITK